MAKRIPLPSRAAVALLQGLPAVLARREADTKALVERLAKRIEAGGFDLKNVCPHPDGRVGRIEYRKAVAIRHTYLSVTSADKARGADRMFRMSDPEYVVMDEQKIARFIEQRLQAARDEFDAFVCKIEGKLAEQGLGQVEDAELEGEYVWGHSVLTIRFSGGGVQRWKTKMIVNYSIYDLAFNQWPTRLMK
jgi:hypothetical protein